jgi:hypothetical protein
LAGLSYRFDRTLETDLLPEFHDHTRQGRLIGLALLLRGHKTWRNHFNLILVRRDGVSWPTFPENFWIRRLPSCEDAFVVMEDERECGREDDGNVGV